MGAIPEHRVQDDTHFTIAMECIERGLHVMVTKPAVKTLEEHRRKGLLLHHDTSPHIAKVHHTPN